jgi:membrane associated rhomboid family serine protease
MKKPRITTNILTGMLFGGVFGAAIGKNWVAALIGMMFGAILMLIKAEG